MQQYFALKKNNDLFEFSHADEHHIINVMRMKINDQIIIIYNQERYLGEIVSLNPLVIEGKMQQAINNELSVDVTLIVPLLKGDKIDWILQKATELGVTKIVPIKLKHCVVKIKNEQLFAHKLKRWSQICYYASAQSKRNKIPEVTNLVVNLQDLKQYLGDLNFIGDLEIENKIDFKTQLNSNPHSITFIFGPEGGFSDDELVELHRLGFNSINLGKRILRAETAPIFFLSVIVYQYEM